MVTVNPDKYFASCPRCKKRKVYQLTFDATAHGVRELAWLRCDGCGLAYQDGLAPSTRKIKPGVW